MRWIHDNAQHTIFGEAMVGEYARAFAGIDEERAVELASSVSLGACVKRARLAEAIRDRLA